MKIPKAQDDLLYTQNQQAIWLLGESIQFLSENSFEE